MPSEPRDRRDESVQFSLKELLKLEDQRVMEQARERDAREAAAARERDEAERRRQADAAAAARAEEEERERKQRSELEELARHEAMEKAIVEQARLEVEVRARTEERERERRHEIEIERLRSVSKKGPSLGAPLVLAAGLGGGVMFLVALAIHLGVHEPSVAARVAELQRRADALEARADDVARQRDEQKRFVGERDAQLADLQTKLAALATKPAAPPGPIKLGHTTTLRGKVPEKEKEVPCLQGDPMCFSLKTGR